MSFYRLSRLNHPWPLIQHIQNLMLYCGMMLKACGWQRGSSRGLQMAHWWRCHIRFVPFNSLRKFRFAMLGCYLRPSVTAPTGTRLSRVVYLLIIWSSVRICKQLQCKICVCKSCTLSKGWYMTSLFICASIFYRKKSYLTIIKSMVWNHILYLLIYFYNTSLLMRFENAIPYTFVENVTQTLSQKHGALKQMSWDSYSRLQKAKQTFNTSTCTLFFVDFFLIFLDVGFYPRLKALTEDTALPMGSHILCRL